MVCEGKDHNAVERTLQQIRYIVYRLEKRCSDFCVRPIEDITGEECRAAFARAFDSPIQQDKARLVLSNVWTLDMKRG